MARARGGLPGHVRYVPIDFNTQTPDRVLRQVVDGDYTGLLGAGASARGLAQIGKPYVSGWTPGEAAAFAREHGLEVVENLGWEEQTRRYLTGADGKVDGRMTDWQRVMEVGVR